MVKISFKVYFFILIGISFFILLTPTSADAICDWFCANCQYFNGSSCMWMDCGETERCCDACDCSSCPTGSLSCDHSCPYGGCEAAICNCEASCASSGCLDAQWYYCNGQATVCTSDTTWDCEWDWTDCTVNICSGSRYLLSEGSCTGGSCNYNTSFDCYQYNGCSNGYDKTYICSGGDCTEDTSTCTTDCCVAHYGAGAYCDGGVCYRPPPQDECTSGVCCDTSSSPYSYRPSTYICNSQYATDYGCPDGTSCGDDVKVRYKTRYCSGDAATCSGTISGWGSWSLADNCSASEYCTDDDSTCNSQCSSGDCCDGCRFRPSSYVCNEHYATDYSCPWGTNCGNDVGVRYKTRSCSGDSPSCSGTISNWGGYTVHDDCLSTETCTDNDSSCNYNSSCDIAACIWQNGNCGAGSCTATQRQQICGPAGCSGGECTEGSTRCVDDAACEPEAFNFSISVSPTSGPVAQGGQVSADVQITRTQGTSEEVDFWRSDLPSGITSDFSPTSCTPSDTPSDTCNSTLTLSAASDAQLVTNWPINVGGTAAGGSSRYVTYNLTVTEAMEEIIPPEVTTGAADPFDQTSATLNGTLNNMGNAESVLVWFEWGTDSVNYGNTTTAQTMTTTGDFSADISELDPDTAYYFRAQAKNGGSW